MSDQSSAEVEYKLRVELAACYRLMALFGWDELVFTHISLRIPGPDHHFLINPYGMLFEEITASSLVKIDLEGNKLEESPWPVNPAGFVIHSAIHAAREDAQCVLHSHCVPGVAVSAQAGGLLPLSQQSSIILASLGYHDYEGIALRDEEKPRLVADMGTANSLILRNHGLLTVGETVGDAFITMFGLIKACEIQLAAQSGGGELIPINQAILDGVSANIDAVTMGMGGNIAWPALLRKLDREMPGYRD